MNSFEIRNGIRHLSKKDAVLQSIIKNAPVCNLKEGRNYFKALLRAIIGQQLSLSAAASINRRFLDFFENKPVPEKILKTDDFLLRKIGLSNSKTKYIKDFSSRLINKEISLRGISKKSDEKIIEELVQVKGIGIWTVQMFLIFTLGRQNVLPLGDLGLKRAIMQNYKLTELPGEVEIKKLAVENNWEPYCSIASWYFWKSLEL